MDSKRGFKMCSMGVSLLALVFLNLSCRPRVTVADLDRLITTEAPKGSNEARVIAMLDSHKIEHSGLLEDPESASDFRYYVPDNRKPLVKSIYYCNSSKCSHQ